MTKMNLLITGKRQLVTAVWRNGGFSAPYNSFLVGSSAFLRLIFCAKNPPLRQAAKRSASKTACTTVNKGYTIGDMLSIRLD